MRDLKEELAIKERYISLLERDLKCVIEQRNEGYARINRLQERQNKLIKEVRTLTEKNKIEE